MSDSKFRFQPEFYGQSEEKPNDHCYWDSFTYPVAGWFENDDHYKKRLSCHIKGKDEASNGKES